MCGRDTQIKQSFPIVHIPDANPYIPTNYIFIKVCEEDEEESGGISIDNISGVFIIVSVGVLISIIVLYVEKWYFNKLATETSKVVSVTPISVQVKIGEFQK